MQSDFVELHLPIHFDPEKLHHKSSRAGIKHRQSAPSPNTFHAVFSFLSLFFFPSINLSS